MYRFRKIHHLLDGYDELENQEIFFSKPEDLNDPMEGFKDIFWQGDAIVWKNFLINYLIAVENAIILTIASGGKNEITIDSITFLNRMPRDLTAQKIQIMKKIKAVFFQYTFIKDLPESLSKRKSPIRRNELLNYLLMVHPYALDSVSIIYRKENIIPTALLSYEIDELNESSLSKANLIDNVNNLEVQQKDNKSTVETSFLIITQFIQSTIFGAICDLKPEQQSSSATILIKNDIPDLFIKKLEMMMYPRWYSASFLKTYNNSAVWAHYGDNHKGCCLIFKEKSFENQFLIDLDDEYGAINFGSLKGFKPQTFHKISYNRKYVEVDFFRSLGRSTISELEYTWYKDENGNISDCANHLYEDQVEWRKTYWSNFIDSISVKLDAWTYEQEYRLIIYDGLRDYSSEESRKLRYKFEDLEGIIFGIKTSFKDKIKIIKIIQDKCKQQHRLSFDFYQAYYNNITGEIDKFKLYHIKLE